MPGDLLGSVKEDRIQLYLRCQAMA